jgi:glycosyltransferase involved in cell wall biosynthesis
MMRRWKRPHLLLDIAERLPQVRFRVIGGRSMTGLEDNYFADIHRRASKLGNVEFLGFKPYAEADRSFDDARLFLNTSDDFEGFPNTFLQAWARGVPTISFVDCGAYDAGRRIGTVVRTVDEMCTAVAELWEDDDLWRNEGDWARSYFRAHHSPETVINKYCEVLDRITPRHSREVAVQKS